MLTITGSAKIPRSATRFRSSEYISSPRRWSISQAPEGATPSRSSMFINSRRRSFTNRARKFPSAASGTQLMISMPGRRIFLAERREPGDRGVDLCEREKGRVAPLGRPGLFRSGSGTLARLGKGERLAVVEKDLPRAGYLRHFLILE